MRYREIIEGRGGVLYHFMDSQKAMAVFSADKLNKKWDHQIGERKYIGTSLTRNNKLRFNSPVRISLDERLLSQRHRIIPVDGEWVFNQTYGSEVTKAQARRDPELYRSRFLKSSDLNNLAEEFLIGDVEEVHRYITMISIFSDAIPGQYAVPLHDLVVEYCHKHSIAYEMDDSFTNVVSSTLQRWAEDDEEDQI